MTQYIFRVGPVAAELLQKIAEYPRGIGTTELKQSGVYRDNHNLVHSLDKLAIEGLIAISDTGKKWLITVDGLVKLSRIKPLATHTPPQVVPARLVTYSEDPYMGEELRPQQARPAGNNHTTIPSLIGGQCVLRRVG